MPDYQKAKIYKIYSVSNEELVYYGSTTERLSTRLAKHIYAYKCFQYVSSKLVLDAGDYKMELIENYPCANKQQLTKRESEYIKNNICVNKKVPHRTQKEYRAENREEIFEKRKVYCENNKEAINERKKVYYENNKEVISEKLKKKVTCDCGCIIRISDLARHKKSNKHLELIIKNL